MLVLNVCQALVLLSALVPSPTPVSFPALAPVELTPALPLTSAPAHVYLVLAVVLLPALAQVVGLALALSSILALSLPGLALLPAWCRTPVVYLALVLALSLAFVALVHVLDGPRVWCLFLAFPGLAPQVVNWGL